MFENDGECDDGGEGAVTSLCRLGTDCTDCTPGGGRFIDDPTYKMAAVAMGLLVAPPPPPPLPSYLHCNDECYKWHLHPEGGGEWMSDPMFIRNSVCDDGGPGSVLDACRFGTDCNDCGPRFPSPNPPPLPPPPPPPKLCGGTCAGQYSMGQVWTRQEVPCNERCKLDEAGHRWDQVGAGFFMNGMETSCICPGTKRLIPGDVTTQCRMQIPPDPRGMELCCTSGVCYKETGWNDYPPPPPPPIWVTDSRYLPLPPPPPPPSPKPPLVTSSAGSAGSTCTGWSCCPNEGKRVSLCGSGYPDFCVTKTVCNCRTSRQIDDYSCVNWDIDCDGAIDHMDCMSEDRFSGFCDCCKPPKPPPPPKPKFREINNLGDVVDTMCDVKDLVDDPYGKKYLKTAADNSKMGNVLKGSNQRACTEEEKMKGDTDGCFTSALADPASAISMPWNWRLRKLAANALAKPDALSLAGLAYGTRPEQDTTRRMRRHLKDLNITSRATGWLPTAGRFLRGHHRPNSEGMMTLIQAREACTLDAKCVGFSYPSVHWFREPDARMPTWLVGMEEVRDANVPEWLLENNPDGYRLLWPDVQDPYRRSPSHVAPTPGKDPLSVDWIDGDLSWTSHLKPSLLPAVKVRAPSRTGGLAI